MISKRYVGIGLDMFLSFDVIISRFSIFYSSTYFYRFLNIDNYYKKDNGKLNMLKYITL